MSRLFPAIATLFSAALTSGTALAQPQLLSANPAANTTIVKPTRLTLRFSDTLLASMSGIELVMTAMPGMSDHAPMSIRGFTTSVEGETLVVALPRALPAGSYDLRWHVVGVDQHQVEGKFAFAVK